MYHSLEFTRDLVADLEIPGEGCLQGVFLTKGTRLKADVTPYVIEGPTTPLEVADLFLADGTTAHRIHFSTFRFLDG